MTNEEQFKTGLEFALKLKDEMFIDKIDSLMQEIKQEPGVSVNQSTYAVRKLEELRKRL